MPCLHSCLCVCATARFFYFRRHYVCVEPGRVSRATAEFPAHAALKPGQAWLMTQKLALQY